MLVLDVVDPVGTLRGVDPFGTRLSCALLVDAVARSWCPHRFLKKEIQKERKQTNPNEGWGRRTVSIFLSRCSSFNWLNSPERANWVNDVKNKQAADVLLPSAPVCVCVCE